VFSDFLNRLIVLHAGTPVELSQVTLTLMFVVLGIILIGISFGFLARNKDSLLQHRWSMTAAIVVALTAILFVMVPSFIRFYIDPDVEIFSSLSIISVIHGVVGGPAIVIGVIYAFGDLPKKTKYWMRWVAAFWIVSIVLGVVVFLDMLGLLSMSM
jgi:uncharacterized membrane protein YozB (DUF420 family)